MTKIIAVARNTISSAIRLKAATVFILLIFSLLPVMSIIITGDGTLKGKLQTFISYSTGLTSFLLCIFTIVVASHSLSYDIKRYLLFTVVTKPLKRYELFLGKILGVVILDLFLLIIFASLIYALTFGIIKYSKSSEGEIEKVKNELLTARASVQPKPLDIARIVDENWQQAKQEQERFKELNPIEVKQVLANELHLQSRSVPPGARRRWQFEGITPGSADKIFVQYKYEASITPPDSMIIGYWVIGDIRPMDLGQPVDIYDVARKDKIKTVYEISVGADKAAIDGHLDVIFENYYGNNTTVIFPDDGIKVLYRAGSFLSNFIRANMLIFCKLIFLAVLGISLSAWLSFPVVMLISFAVFFIGTISGFIIDSFGYVEGAGIVFKFIGSVIYLLPRFDGKYSPVNYLVNADLISLNFLGYVSLMQVAVQSGLAAVLGILIFNKREIAKVSA